MKVHFPNSVAEINLNTLLTNIETVKKKNPGKKILSVVKCDAYRHGAVHSARHIEESTDWFGVATVDEGIELRMGGIKKPILVFGVPAQETAAAYVTHNLSATVSHAVHFSILMDGTRYHLNFDTGMRRLGFTPDEAPEVRKLAIANQRLVCGGIYSHFATADDPGNPFVNEQHKRFREVTEIFSEVSLIHMSNTGFISHYNLNRFSMIRMGLAIYGYNSGRVQVDWLTPALTWKTRIVQVRPVKKGETVSYAASWECPEDGYLATLPVGYGDGIPRSLSNKLKVRIGDKYYRQVGNVTMDFIMVYLKKDKPATDTEVTLMGGNAWNASQWAEHGETNVHEILTNLTGRVVKTYIDV
ncbi:MAG: alanine racemase [Balneolaceae bacterium]